MAGVKSHWNQTVADDPLGTAKREGPGRVSTTSSAGDAAGPMTSGGSERLRSRNTPIGDVRNLPGIGGRVIREYFDKDKPKSTNEIQGVNRKR